MTHTHLHTPTVSFYPYFEPGDRPRLSHVTHKHMSHTSMQCVWHRRHLELQQPLHDIGLVFTRDVMHQGAADGVGYVRLGTCAATRHTSHVTRHTSYVTRHTSHVTRYTSHVTRHTSHVTRHTSQVTRHTCYCISECSFIALRYVHDTTEAKHLHPTSFKAQNPYQNMRMQALGTSPLALPSARSP